METPPHGAHGAPNALVSDATSPLRPHWRNRFGVLLLRIALGGVFLFAGITKARDPGDFAGDLRGYRLFSEITVLPLAAYLPYLEIIVGAALIFGILYSGAMLLAGSLLLAFDAVIISAMWRKLDITCGCFGHHGANPPLWGSLLRNCLLLLIWCVLAGMLMKRKPDIVATA